MLVNLIGWGPPCVNIVIISLAIVVFAFTKGQAWGLQVFEL